jgi:dephospho-CoA kinase
MRRVALTGGIATGKSYVLDRFRRLGVPCVDADELAHGVMAAGTEASRAIAERFGPAVLAADGSVDRAVLGPIVFRDAAARRDLEAIVHPAVRRSLAAVLQTFERTDGVPVAIVALPLLHETGRAAEFDRVIATVCASDTQRARLLARGLSEDEARRRLEAQWPAADKTRGAHWIIHTDGSFADTDRQVDEIAAALATLPPQ